MTSPPWTSGGSQPEPLPPPGRPSWLPLAIAASVGIVLAAVALVAVALVQNSGPAKADRYRAAEVRSGLVVLGSKGYGSDSEIDRMAHIVCEDLSTQARETGGPLNGQVAETFLITKGADVRALMGRTLGVDPGFAGVDYDADPTALARFATSTGRSIANLHSIYCPSAPFDPSAPPTSPGGGDAQPPTAPASSAASQGADPSSPYRAGQVCTDARAISRDSQTGTPIVCDFSGSTSGGQWRTAAGIPNEARNVGEPCDSATDTIARDQDNKAIICDGTVWSTGP